MITNSYGQKAQICKNYDYENNICRLFNCTCVISKNQYCQKFRGKNIITIKDLASAISIPQPTLHNYLDGYRFSKYRLETRPQMFELSYDFISELINFFELKGSTNGKLYQKIKVLEKWKIKNGKITID